EVLNLTQRGQYTIITAAMRNYQLQNTPAKIESQGLVKNPPALYESYVQKYENGIAIDESEIDNYVYDKDIMIMKGLDPNGNTIEFFYIPQMSLEIEAWITENRLWRTLFNQRDRLNDQDFDGIVP